MATKFDAVLGSELRDTQSEILDIKGADISELLAGRGVVNDNHSNKLPDVLGRITSAKKIFGIEDCETERQRYYWNKIKAPYLYGEGILYDDEDHRSAKAAAAILKHQFKTDSPLKLKCSVEGGIIERGEKDQRVLKRTKIRGLALTFTPANNATLVEGLDLAKSAVTVEELELIKSYIPHAIQDVPSFIDFSQKISIAKIRHNVEQIHEMVDGLKKNNDLNKALTAGYGGAGSPTNLTGGGVLQAETLDQGRSFRYIDCPNCGKDQVYMAHQTKCRSCNKSFPFDTLARFFVSKS
jgi:hypothetical protein